MDYMKRKLTIAQCLAPALLLAALPLDGPARAQVNTAAPALTVTAAAAEQVSWPDMLRATGAIEPWQQAIVSAQVGGQRLVEIHAEIGDTVRAGQVLARFDTATLRAEEAELTASLQQAQASLLEAEANRARAMALQERNLLSAQDVTRQITQADIARAQLAAAEARLASKRLQLKYAEVVAPDAGVVSARNATLGGVAQLGDELFRLIRQSRLEWRGELTAPQLARVAVGADVELVLPNGTRTTARVRQVAPTLSETSRLAMVYADLPESSSARAGMYAEGTVLLEPTAAVVVPATSVVIRDGRSYVFVLDGAGETARVAAVAVQVGRRIGDRVEIRAGIAPGARVVAQGAGFLNDGDVVRVARVEVTAGSAE
jgi:RND family efflux transporter MFP subunit